VIKREIAAHSGEDLGVLPEAFLLEEFLGETAPRKVAITAIDLVEPALVLPGTAADEDIARRQFPQTRGEVLARERVRVFE
jgi:hypothetical protein